MFPLVIHSLDLVVSAAGIMSIGSKSTATPLQPVEDPYAVIKVCLPRLNTRVTAWQLRYCWMKHRRMVRQGPVFGRSQSPATGVSIMALLL